MPDPAPDRDTPPTYEHRWEDELEPKHLIARSEIILRLGALMLGAGTGSRRVKEAMASMARALDLDGMQAQVTLTEIVLTVQRRGVFRTQVAEIPSPGVNADRIAALQRYAQTLPRHVTVAEASRRLDEVVARGRLYPEWAVPVAAALACSAFALLNNAGALEAVAVAIAAGVGQLLRHALVGRHLNQLGVILLAAVVACVVYLGVTELAHSLFGLVSTRHEGGFISSVLFLVPGFPLITATLDLARLDLAAGISRLTYAMLVTLAAAMGVWGVAAAAGVHPVAPPALPLGAVALLVLRLVATFFGVLGFAIIFNSPMRVAIAAAAIATIANTPRLYAVGAGMPPQLAAGLATLGVGLLAWVVGALLKLPRIILSVPAVVIMIPGAIAYRALVLFEEGDVVGALTQGVTAILVVTGMAVGLAAARMLTDPDWAFTSAATKRYSLGIAARQAKDLTSDLSTRIQPHLPSVPALPTLTRRRRRSGDSGLDDYEIESDYFADAERDERGRRDETQGPTES